MFASEQTRALLAVGGVGIALRCASCRIAKVKDAEEAFAGAIEAGSVIE